MSLAIALASHLFDSSNERSGRLPPAVPVEQSEPPTADCVRRLQNGDESALREVVQQYATPLIRFANAMVHDAGIAESIAYDVLSTTWTRREHLDPNRSLIAYLFTAVRRRVWDELERRGVRTRHVEKVQSGWDPDTSWIAPSPEHLLLERTDAEAQAIRLAHVQRALETFDERRRLALHLRFEQGMSYPAIGEILGISDKAAQQLILRTIGALRKVLGV